MNPQYMNQQLPPGNFGAPPASQGYGPPQPAGPPQPGGQYQGPPLSGGPVFNGPGMGAQPTHTMPGPPGEQTAL